MKFKNKEILLINNLKLHYAETGGFFKTSNIIKAVDGVSFRLISGETLGIVGESGSGKSSICRLILNLIVKTSGEISWFGKNLDNYSKKEMKDFRKKVQIIFQDPYGSLDPRMTIGSIIREPLDIFNEKISRKEKDIKIFQIMNDVGLTNDLFNRYPHELSGGQCQRVGIARALINKPSVLICDEPVSALDLSIQAQILELLSALKNKYKLTLIFVSHDLSVIKSICDKVIVLKHGSIIENRETNDLFNNPKDDYTKKLISSVPSPIPLGWSNGYKISNKTVVWKINVKIGDKVYEGQ